MENAFTIEIELDSEQMIFDARLDTIGFVHKIYINVSGVDVAFEPDEERSYREIIKPTHISSLTEKNKSFQQLAKNLEEFRQNKFVLSKY